MAGRRVLLVEDNAINRDLATELLADLGISVEIAVNGREGVARVTTEAFDLVLMDIQMPEMDGLTATRLIRSDERLRDLPIIAMTAHAMSGDREKSLGAGMNDHLTKPIDPENLTEALSRWISPESPPAYTPERTLAEKTLPPTQAPADDGVPEYLPPFDIPAALVRSNGKPRLLRKLLLSFHDTYADVVPELRKLVAEGSHTEAERLAHSLKGNAGTLEAGELSVAAAKVERAFREGKTEEITPLLDALEKVLAPAIAATAGLYRRKVAAPPPSPAPSSYDKGEVAATLDELRQHIAANSMKARKLFAPLGEKLIGGGAEEEIGKLGERLENLDFQGALAALDQLATKLVLTERKSS